VNITVSAISPHCVIGVADSAVVSTADKAVGVSLDIHGPFADHNKPDYSATAMKD
jgi:hypothetical protein